MVRQIPRPLLITREVPLDRQVLLQNPLKATGALSNTLSELQLETCPADLPGQFKQPGYIDVQGCLDETLWSEFYFIFLCLRSWTDSHTSGAKPPSLSAPLQRWRKLVLPTERFLRHSMQAKASLAMNTVCMFTFVFSLLGDLQLKRSWMYQESFWHRRKPRHT